MRPENFLHFIETDEFRDDWNALGLTVENDLLALQVAIMVSPDLHPVIKGTGGLRKLRFSSTNACRGKSGGIRVCYAYFPRHWTVLLVMAYGKSQQDNLTKTEKSHIKEYLGIIEQYLNARHT